MKRNTDLEFVPKFTTDGRLKFATLGGDGTIPAQEGRDGLRATKAPNAKCGCGCDAVIEVVRTTRDWGLTWTEKKILRCLGYGLAKGPVAAKRAAEARARGWAYDYKRPCPAKTLEGA